MEGEPAHGCAVRLDIAWLGLYWHHLWSGGRGGGGGRMCSAEWLWWQTLFTSGESSCHWKETVWEELFRRKTSLRRTPNRGRCPKHSRSSESSASCMTRYSVPTAVPLYSTSYHHLSRDCYGGGLGNAWGLLSQYLTIPHCHQTLSPECHQYTLSIGEHNRQVNLAQHKDTHSELHQYTNYYTVEDTIDTYSIGLGFPWGEDEGNWSGCSRRQLSFWLQALNDFHHVVMLRSMWNQMALSWIHTLYTVYPIECPPFWGLLAV